MAKTIILDIDIEIPYYGNGMNRVSHLVLEAQIKIEDDTNNFIGIEECFINPCDFTDSLSPVYYDIKELGFWTGRDIYEFVHLMDWQPHIDKCIKELYDRVPDKR